MKKFEFIRIEPYNCDKCTNMACYQGCQTGLGDRTRLPVIRGNICNEYSPYDKILYPLTDVEIRMITDLKRTGVRKQLSNILKLNN